MERWHYKRSNNSENNTTSQKQSLPQTGKSFIPHWDMENCIVLLLTQDFIGSTFSCMHHTFFYLFTPLLACEENATLETFEQQNVKPYNFNVEEVEMKIGVSAFENGIRKYIGKYEDECVE